MKNKILLFLFLSFIIISLINCNPDCDVIISFPDPNLEAIIREEIKKPTGDICLCDVENIISLDAQAKNISDLTGIENLTSLYSLIFYNNNISDISPLSELSSLTYLALDLNNISNIDALSDLHSLEKITLCNNTISDINAFTNLSSLRVLALNENNINDISVLSGITSLEDLHLNNNNISDISPLIANSGIGTNEIVDLTNNPLTAESEAMISILEARGVIVYY